MKLLAQDTLAGHGNLGEGMAMQLRPGGQRILWLAHESAPMNYSAVDVTDPRAPKVILQTKLPHQRMRSNSLDLSGNLMAVAYQTSQPGLDGAGFEILDVADPLNPKRVNFFDCSGPHSRGVHQLWFVDGERVHMSSGAPDFTPRHPRDDQIYRIVDVTKSAKFEEIGRWWLPGTAEGDAEPPPSRAQVYDGGHFRVHNTNVYPERPDRAYLGYLDGGAILLDIADPARPRVVSRWDNSPPFPGFTHTVLPLFERGLWVVTDESIVDKAEDWPKLMWVLDARDETNPISISTFPAPPPELFTIAGGRYGAHNIHENQPGPGSWKSERYILGTFFSGGVRVYDLKEPFRPEEVAYYVPEAPAGSPAGSAQINDVFVDDRGIVFAVDRLKGGLYVLELSL